MGRGEEEDDSENVRKKCKDRVGQCTSATSLCPPPCLQFEALHPEGISPGWSIVVKGETSSSSSM